MLFRLPVEVLIVLIPILLFSLCFHEYAHALAAYRLGDHTAFKQGRLTLMPMVHLDPMGTLMILFVGFGWAKPVPVTVSNLNNPRSDLMIIAAAGPISNLFLAFLGSLIFNSNFIYDATIMNSIYYFIYINIALAIFNLIPIPPLDGSQILTSILSKKNYELAYKIKIYGPSVLFGLIIFGYITNVSIIGIIMGPFISFFLNILI